VARAPERLWSVPLDGDQLATLVVDDRGELAVSTSRERRESRIGGFDARQWSRSSGPGGFTYCNLYAHRSYGIDPRGRVTWEHAALRIARAIPNGWAALTDRHDLMLIDDSGVATRRRRLRGDTWRICGWRTDEPVVTSDPDAIWVDPYVYRARDGQLQVASETGRRRGAVDLPRAAFADEYRRDRPPPGPWDSFSFPRRLRLTFHRERSSLIAIHRLHMAWVASITLDGELVWVRLLDHACCNSASVIGDRIVHTSSCGSKVTVLAGDGRVLASRCVPHVQDAVADGQGGMCVRLLNGLCGLDENLTPTWELSTDPFPHVTARDGVLYVAAGEPGALALTAYALA
jgi:hypothetical protein